MTRATLAVIVVIAMLFAVTTRVATVYRGERQARADAHFAQGQVLEAAGRPEAATEEYRAALSLVREEPRYERALARALLTLGRYGQAETWTRELLARYPTDGTLNRTLARIAAARGSPDEARVYYRRAIYGEWEEDELPARIDTRLELVEYLRQTAARDELLAELLRLKAEVPSERTADARRLGSLLLDAGRFEDAADVLRAAREAAPDDEMLQAQLEETSRLLALNPMASGLRPAERNRRARLLLSAVREEIEHCADPQPADLVALADAQLQVRAGVADPEDDLQLARRLWEASPACQDGTAEGRAIARVLEALDNTEAPGA